MRFPQGAASDFVSGCFLQGICRAVLVAVAWRGSDILGAPGEGWESSTRRYSKEERWRVRPGKEFVTERLCRFILNRLDSFPKATEKHE